MDLQLPSLKSETLGNSPLDLDETDICEHDFH